VTNVEAGLTGSQSDALGIWKQAKKAAPIVFG
jgi:hypothetical protein